MRRLRTPVVVVILMALMAGFGWGVNRFFASRQSALTTGPAEKPTQSKPAFSLPGTIVVAQQGALYVLEGGTFKEITGQDGWSQPVALPGGGLIAVKRGTQWSDLYELGLDGSVKQQLTHNEAKKQDADHISQNHWVYYPSVSPDGSRLFFGYDEPKAGYRVDMAIWSSPLGPVTTRTLRQESVPNDYTGGDVSPVPLSNGDLLYVKYSVGGDGMHYSQVWWQKRPRSEGLAVTQPKDQCSQPALSPDGTTLAMVCSPNEQEADLVTTSFDPATGKIGTLRRLVTGTMAGAPSWSPDGKSLLFIAPQDASGWFQLWWIDRAGTATPAAPRMITDGKVDLDATSAACWLAPAGATGSPAAAG